MLSALAIGVVLESHKDQAVVRCRPREAESHDRERRRNIALTVQDAFGLPRDLAGVFERRACRCLHDADEIAFILVRHKRRRHHLEHRVGGPPRADKQHKHGVAEAQCGRHGAHVAPGPGLDHGIDPAEQQTGRVRLPCQQQRRQGRRECDGIEHRQHHRKCNRQRELLIEPASHSGKERHRDEHRHQDQSDDNDGTEDLAHGIDGCPVRRLAILGHVPLDVLDHHNRIIHDDARGKYDTEQRQGIDRESEQLDEGEGANQRHGNRHRRNHGAAPVLQEDKHHEDDESNGLGQRLEHLGDRLAHHADVVECQLPLEPGWKVGLDAGHRRHHPVVDLEGVGRGQQRNAHPRSLEAQKAQRRRILLGPEFDAAHIAHAYERPVSAGLYHHVLELADLGEAADGTNAHGVKLSLIGGLVAEGAGRNLHVLLAQRAEHITGRQPTRGKPGGVEPQAHGIASLAEDDDVPHPRHALDRITHVEVEIVADELVRVPVVAAEHADSAHEPGRQLADADAVGAHVGRHTAQHRVHAVLHVDCREVGIARHVECHRNRRHTGVGRRGGDVGHALDAVDGLLKRRRHRALDRLRIGAGVERRHRHRGRREFRIACDRQRGNRHGTGQNDEQRTDRRQNRSTNKAIGHHRQAPCFPLVAGAAGAAGGAGMTGAPSPIF